MTPETALTEISRGLEIALVLGAPPLLMVLVVGVVVGIVQAATQINEATIAFVVKALALVATLAIAGNFLLGRLTAFTIDLFHRIPQLIG
ncbi:MULTISPECIES: flagellar biosynthetic protein FliQ [Pseudoxanthomonas]|jgi:flagellar biosynthetic protein FliQ|uniref:Flagellar biosynthetic protein FliQ n=1 Tax=Pseudoxanthomonas winnipegensis TaxID=2480810 RepID=A0A4Q8LGS3_9GAMM|nr:MULTISPECIES: flagellar biosynthetic protein FliQ [Pseudoxanthomonas]PZP64106.1 MAG: flagellar biogenesis protein [Pseudoxanthomonas spadix]MDQ1120160.1 flagellar biosynthetic protein FliQ [Pseudoxanthomonas winnipegensis]MDQ1133371.1 flagellar biosynthetic protein FliQ [Pseudoxanthomonas winnipegensis]MDR6140384.1 flagellar biosynthetic protein FliQ [Pseudoxanthomonas sp. SORGH_AS_0997]RZZ83096.1 flagellar biosynthetic protein FliQ [Pseudoxanthomonas winnipegensis]